MSSKSSKSLIISQNFVEYISCFPHSGRFASSPPDDDGERSALSSISRARVRMRRLCYSNTFRFSKLNGWLFTPVFITVTYKENFSDLPLANRSFSKFIQRFNYFLGHQSAWLQYVAVPEFQKRGAVHYHMIFFNLPFIERGPDVLRKLWREGYQVKMKATPDVRQVGSYLAPYLMKQGVDERFFCKRRFFSSRGLFEPLRIVEPEVINQLLISMPVAIETKYFSNSFADYTSYLLSEPLHIFDYQKPAMV
jgi:hypothetical protein